MSRQLILADLLVDRRIKAVDTDEKNKIITHLVLTLDTGEKLEISSKPCIETDQELTFTTIETITKEI